MNRNLLFLVGSLAFCSTAYAVTPDFSMSFLNQGKMTSRNDVKVSNCGDIRYSTSAGPKRVKALAPESENSDDLYNIDVLLNEDFASLGEGNMENPTAVNITEENGDLKGLPGWSGVNVYDAGNAVYVDMKFIIDEEAGWGQPEGEIWTPAIKGVAGKTVRLRANVKGVYEDDEMIDSMNCIFMAYSDELPGEHTLIDFPYFHISSDFETEEVTLEIPETISFHIDEESVECPISYVRVKLQPMETPFFISSLEMATVSPKVGVPEGLSFGNFSDEGYTASWDSVEGADKYEVEFFTSEFDSEEFEFILTPYATESVTEPSCDIKIPTDKPTFYQVTAYSGDLPSPVSEMFMVYSALPPKMKEAKLEDGKVTVTWEAQSGAAGTEIFAYRQVNIGDAGKDYNFLDIDFSNATDSDEGDEILWLDDFAYGWAALPYPMIEDGAVSINNSGALWGMPDAKLISTNTYDFSNVTGKVKMIITAKTPDDCGMVVAMGGTDPTSGETITLDVADTELTEEFADYEFELEGNNPETMFLVQADNSLGTLVVRRIQIIADFADNSQIGYPYYSDFVDASTLSFDVPEGEFECIKAVGRTIKQVNVDMMGHAFTIAEAVSGYSDPIYTSEGSKVTSIEGNAMNAEYYTIDGRKISGVNPTDGGMYIKKVGEKATKVIR